MKVFFGFFSVHAKAALAHVKTNNTGVTGRLNCPKLTLSMHVFGPRNSAYAFWDTTDIYISREISIEQPSVGLALLAQ